MTGAAGSSCNIECNGVSVVGARRPGDFGADRLGEQRRQRADGPVDFEQPLVDVVPQRRFDSLVPHERLERHERHGIDAGPHGDTLAGLALRRSLILSQTGCGVMLPAMNARKLYKLKNEMRAFVEDVAACIGRSERKHLCSTYLRGLLLHGDRKSIEPIAGRLTAIDQPEKDYVRAFRKSLMSRHSEASPSCPSIRR